MIIKNLSKKGGIGTLVRYVARYILQENKVSPRRKRVVPQIESPYAGDLLPQRKPAFINGIRVEQKDIKYLYAERNDFRLWQEYKRSGIQDHVEFVKTHILKSELPILLKHNLRSTLIEGITKEFEQNEAGRIRKSSNSIKIHHTILSWSNLDSHKLTEAKITDMVSQYIKLRGENNLYLSAIHQDRSHLHAHIIMSATQLNGKSTRISKNEFEQIKVQLQEFQKQKYPELENSIVQHQKSNDVGKEQWKNANETKRLNIKNSLLEGLDTIYGKATSSKQFYSEVQKQGYEIYQRANRITGIRHDGIKFRFKTLGYDEERLKYLDSEKAHEDRALAEIQALREQRPIREISKNTRMETLEGMEKSLEKIQYEPIKDENDNGLDKGSSVDSQRADFENDLEELGSFRDNNDMDYDIDDERSSPETNHQQDENDNEDEEMEEHGRNDDEDETDDEET